MSTVFVLLEAENQDGWNTHVSGVFETLEAAQASVDLSPFWDQGWVRSDEFEQWWANYGLVWIVERAVTTQHETQHGSVNDAM